MRTSCALLVLPLACSAFQLPFKVPFLSSNSVVEPEPPTGTPRIAIIAAFWIAATKERFGLDVEVDVYEKESYVGGRSTIVYPYNDTTLPPVELGGSIFVKANKNMWRASEEFNLTRRNFDDPNSTMGVWDGSSMLFSVGDGWWENAKMLWRFGMAPLKAKWITDNMISKYLRLYAPDTPRWEDVKDLTSQLGVADLLEQTAQASLKRKASTRVNYGQNIDDMHAFGATCSIATSGATGIEGGNYQIFEHFLKHSGANVYLNTPVVSISDSHTFWTVRTAGTAKAYKAVIFATSFHSSGITLNAPNAAEVPEVPYYSLMRRHNGTVPEFNSLAYHGAIRDGEWVVKIFSQQELSDEWLSDIFIGQVGWVHRKEWDAYPRLLPNSPMPQFISTMETETVAARNVVDLLLNDAFGLSICGHRLSAPASRAAQDPNFVYGWDC
ncbi:hypothetical protein BD626DRAFT_485778 [Schizophyllum amplum]|uniref:Prenylcysteine lyase domain-containing protein n=1 Tax=Schizophyllum amplum TaxID=97359 RepID=A0A550CLU3_9AGAR|nr:hypothetical protein BD626DRAFT_485778 [Auriculariopsis ampla]